MIAKLSTWECALSSSLGLSLHIFHSPAHAIGPLAALSWHAFRGCWEFALDLDPADYCFQLTGVGDLFLYNISSFCYPVPSGTLDTNMHRGIDMILNRER